MLERPNQCREGCECTLKKIVSITRVPGQLRLIWPSHLPQVCHAALASLKPDVCGLPREAWQWTRRCHLSFRGHAAVMLLHLLPKASQMPELRQQLLQLLAMPAAPHLSAANAMLSICFCANAQATLCHLRVRPGVRHGLGAPGDQLLLLCRLPGWRGPLGHGVRSDRCIFWRSPALIAPQTRSPGHSALVSNWHELVHQLVAWQHMCHAGK